MGTKTKKSQKEKFEDNEVVDRNEIVARQLYKMKHRDLQRACIVRGLPPEQLVEMSHPNLVLWFYENFERTEDETLLIFFDEYIEGVLEQKGYPAGKSFRDPVLRFSFVEPIAEGVAEVKEIRVKADKPKSDNKEPATKHPEWDIMTGTKKFLAYSLAIQTNLTITEIIEKVKEEYSEAEEKSIKIWIKRAIAFRK